MLRASRFGAQSAPKRRAIRSITRARVAGAGGSATIPLACAASQRVSVRFAHL